MRLLPYLYTVRIWLNIIKSKAFRSSRSQMFYKIIVPENFAKFTGNLPLPNNVARLTRLHYKFFPIFCEMFKNTYFLISPQNETTLQRKQISKIT